jgi:ABC-type branched-subunit amino acid transport system permease subunit
MLYMLRLSFVCCMAMANQGWGSVYVFVHAQQTTSKNIQISSRTLLSQLKLFNCVVRFSSTLYYFALFVLYVVVVHVCIQQLK